MRGRGRGGRGRGGRGGGRRGRGGRGRPIIQDNQNGAPPNPSSTSPIDTREGDMCKIAFKPTGEDTGEQVNDNSNNNQDDNASIGCSSTTSMDHHHCLVCYSPTLHTSRGITPCNHDTICASCHLRLRSLLGDNRCPVCKATNETVIIDADLDPSINEHKTFDQYERWGDDLGPNFIYHDDVRMFFPVSYYHRKVVPLFSLRCNVRGCNYGDTNNRINRNNSNNSSSSNNNNSNNNNNSSATIKGLNHHLAAAHSLSLCQLCVENKRDFISRLPRFTPNQLKEHNKYGDFVPNAKGGGGGKNGRRRQSDAKGHPLCQFCAPKRFYDLTALHEHLNKEHYKCHVCEKLGVHNQFFRDYHKLSMHFEKEHYLCPHPDCLAARFVVFANDIDLMAHERDMHGIVNRNGGRAINIEFNYRSTGRGGDYIINENQTVPDLEEDFNYGVNGEVFVPEALEDGDDAAQQQQENEPEITHGPHAERTAYLREQARKRREELGLGSEEKDDETEAFPALGSSGGGDALRWSAAAATANGGTTMVTSLRGRNSTALTEENFPSLGGGQPKKKSAISSKLRVTRTAGGFGTNSPSLAAVARSVAPSYANARPMTRTTTPGYFSSNVAASMNSAANLTSNNFPSLGGGSSVSSRNTSASTANKYAEAQAFTKKNNLSSDNFPSLGNSTSAGTSASAQSFAKKKKNSIFDPPKKPPALDNMIHFPTPIASSSVTSNGEAQVEKMKRIMGQTKYKELKKLTKRFATNDIDPESYVSSAVHLFDKGIEDGHFWEFIPSLISSCPNESSSKRAKRYLDSMRYPILQSEEKKASANSSANTNRNGSGSNSRGGGWSDHVNAIQNSFQRAQPQKKNAWAAAGQTKKVSSKISNSVAEAALEGPRKGTATKYMAKERAEEKKMRQVESESQQGATGKKKKATAKKNELRDLAFGKN